jgi:hypothetical protein
MTGGHQRALKSRGDPFLGSSLDLAGPRVRSQKLEPPPVPFLLSPLMNQHWFFPFFCSKWLRENVPTM